MGKMKNLPIRFLSAFLAIAFLLQEVSYAFAYEPAALIVPVSASSEANLLLSDPFIFKAPLDEVSVKEIHKGPKDVFIIHIQDAHNNLSGQE
ncbi:MAG: hypothetical protein WCG06_06015, partial [Candidatus Omnitrophota bacterium]